MYQPESYAVALAFMIVTMLCWGSWANTLKLTPGYRFQLFYWDYVIGLFVGAIAWGLTLGSMGNIGLPFLADISHAGSHNILLAILGGIDFNIANLLLVAAIGNPQAIVMRIADQQIIVAVDAQSAGPAVVVVGRRPGRPEVVAVPVVDLDACGVVDDKEAVFRVDGDGPRLEEVAVLGAALAPDEFRRGTGAARLSACSHRGYGESV